MSNTFGMGFSGSNLSALNCQTESLAIEQDLLNWTGYSNLYGLDSDTLRIEAAATQYQYRRASYTLPNTSDVYVASATFTLEAGSAPDASFRMRDSSAATEWGSKSLVDVVDTTPVAKQIVFQANDTDLRYSIEVDSSAPQRDIGITDISLRRIISGAGVAVYGDSMVQGIGATTPNSGGFPTFLQRLIPSTFVLNAGVGGQGPTDIADRFIADTDIHPWFLVLWEADDGGTKAELDRAIAVNTGLPYIVLGNCSQNDVSAVNGSMASAYGDNFINIKQLMITETGQNDYADFRSDVIHLNDAGYEFVAQTVFDKIKTLL